MSQRLTIRLSDELARWLDQTAKETGIPRSTLVTVELEKAYRAGGRAFLRLAGCVDGAADLSARKGFRTR